MQATELPVLDEDRQLDEDSSNTGEQRFEKLTAGLYMGDIARRIILRWDPAQDLAVLGSGHIMNRASSRKRWILQVWLKLQLSICPSLGLFQPGSPQSG